MIHVVALTILSLDLSHAAPAVCDEACALIRDEGLAPSDRMRALGALLHPSMPSVVVRADALVARGSDASHALTLLTHAVHVACDSAPVDVEVARARATEILRDEAFHGARERDDILDLFIARARAFFVAFLESAGMQRFSGISRVVYLSLVCGVALALAFRLLVLRRRWLRVKTKSSAIVASAHRSQRTVGALLDEAEHALANGARDDALALIENALAALTVDDTRVRSATHDDILRALPPENARALRAHVETLERALYARDRYAPDDIGALVVALRRFGTTERGRVESEGARGAGR